jgi:hypothetical protein
MLKMQKLLLIWISDQQGKGDNVHSEQQKHKRIFNHLKDTLYWCLFIQRKSAAFKHMTLLNNLFL